ncbi:phage minor head protein [Mesorhizobium sp. M0058]|uniref:phage minor head protein n=1 Tax=Mesorhizobium sp. M0058 TaxID=2956865 RepID=UPI00333A4C36
MARRPTPRQRLDQLLDRFGGDIRAAFIESVHEIRDTARIAAIAGALEAGNVERALELIGLDPAAFRSLQRSLRTTFEETGVVVVRDIPALRDGQGVQLLLRFDPGNPAAARWVENRGARLVTAILDDQRTALRQALSDGLAAGRGPRSVALDIVGRINRATGKREGGIVGLTSGQYQTVANARQQLLSGDPAELRAYLGRQARDKRFDQAVIKAISDGKPVPADIVDRALSQYANRMLDLRGEMIGRTEATQAVGAAQREAFEQVIDTAKLDRDVVTQVWLATHDSRTREAHLEMDGQETGFDEPFTSPSGALLMFPGDMSLGAGPEDTIGCRCVVITRLGGREAAAA